jgi:hypothetical protein
MSLTTKSILKLLEDINTQLASPYLLSRTRSALPRDLQARRRHQ